MTTSITQLTGTATFTSWDEQPGWDTGAPVPRLAHATVGFVYRGDFEGTSTCRYVLHHTSGRSGVAVGLERVQGTVDGREASFALRHEGTFDDEGVAMRVAIVPGSGTGAMSGAAGGGDFRIPSHATEWTWRLDWAG